MAGVPPVATRTIQTSTNKPFNGSTEAGGALGPSRKGYGTNYPDITVQEPLRSNDSSRQLGFPERGIGRTTPRYEAPQTPIDYVDIPIERGLPVGRTPQQRTTQGGGYSGDRPYREPVTQGDGRFGTPIMFPQSDPRNPSNAAGFESGADWKAWQNGELTRSEAEKEAAAGRWLAKPSTQQWGANNTALPDAFGTDVPAAYEAGNRWRVRNGLSPVGLDGKPFFKDGKMPSNGARPTPYGPPIPDTWKNPEKKPFADPKDFRPISPFSPFSPPSGLNPDSDIDPKTGAPIGNPDYKPRTIDPFAPTLPPLPANPFPPGSPGGGVSPGSAPTNPEGRGTWGLQTSNKGVKQWAWAYPNRLASDVPTQTNPTRSRIRDRKSVV